MASIILFNSIFLKKSSNYLYFQVEKDVYLPVMAYFYGGGFVSGSSSSELYGPEYILDSDVVLVVINYRVGPLGKLSKYLVNN